MNSQPMNVSLLGTGFLLEREGTWCRRYIQLAEINNILAK